MAVWDAAPPAGMWDWAGGTGKRSCGSLSLGHLAFSCALHQDGTSLQRAGLALGNAGGREVRQFEGSRAQPAMRAIAKASVLQRTQKRISAEGETATHFSPIAISSLLAVKAIMVPNANYHSGET